MSNLLSGEMVPIYSIKGLDNVNYITRRTQTHCFIPRRGQEKPMTPDGKWLPRPLYACDTWGITCVLSTLHKPIHFFLEEPHIVAHWENLGREFIPQAEGPWEEIPLKPSLKNIVYS